MDFLVRILRSIWGVCPTQRGVFHETGSNHANFCRIGDCFRGEIHQSRGAGPPEWPQLEARRPLAQSRPPTAPQKKSRPSQTQCFMPLCLPDHTSNQVTTSLTSAIAVRRIPVTVARVGLCCPRGGVGVAPAHPRDPRRRSPRWLLTGIS